MGGGGSVPQTGHSLIKSVFLELIFERNSWITVWDCTF